MKPVIYQLLPRLFGNRCLKNKRNGTIAENGCGKFCNITSEILNKISQLGFSHVWYTGIIRHATTTDYTAFNIPKQHNYIVKGKAGSPYAIADYYDVDPDLAIDIEKRMDEFEALVERTHQAGLKVIIDFVPNHVAREYKSICKPSETPDLGENDNRQLAFSPNNNFYYIPNEHFSPKFDIGDYKEIPAFATGNDCFSAHPSKNDWYETIKLNYGFDYMTSDWRREHFYPTPPTWFRMLEILHFWCSKGIDGLRCDMAEMVPVAFWQWAIEKLKKEFPNIIFIGELYQPNLYRQFIDAGFDWIYDKVDMYDCLRGVMTGCCKASEITHQWQNVDDIHNHMLYFLENHDEQRIASDFFAADGKQGIPAMIIISTMRNNPVMIYAGQEFGERGMDKEGFSRLDGRTTIFDYWILKTLLYGFSDRRKLPLSSRQLYKKYEQILRIATKEKAVTNGLFFDLMYVNPQLHDKQFAFIRKYENEMLLIAVNFDNTTVDTNIYIPQHAFEYLHIEDRRLTGVNLMNNQERNELIKADCPIRLTIAPHDGCIIKYIFNDKL